MSRMERTKYEYYFVFAITLLLILMWDLPSPHTPNPVQLKIIYSKKVTINYYCSKNKIKMLLTFSNDQFFGVEIVGVNYYYTTKHGSELCSAIVELESQAPEQASTTETLLNRHKIS